MSDPTEGEIRELILEALAASPSREHAIWTRELAERPTLEWAVAFLATRAHMAGLEAAGFRWTLAEVEASAEASNENGDAARYQISDAPAGPTVAWVWPDGRVLAVAQHPSMVDRWTRLSKMDSLDALPEDVANQVMAGDQEIPF